MPIFLDLKKKHSLYCQYLTKGLGSSSCPGDLCILFFIFKKYRRKILILQDSRQRVYNGVTVLKALQTRQYFVVIEYRIAKQNEPMNIRLV